MEPGRSDELSQAAAEFAKAAARVVQESGVPRHRWTAVVQLFEAELNAMMDLDLARLAETIEASPQKYSARERKEMFRAVLAAGVERVRATMIEQLAAWSATERKDGDRGHDSG